MKVYANTRLAHGKPFSNAHFRLVTMSKIYNIVKSMGYMRLNYLKHSDTQNDITSIMSDK